MPIRSAMRTAGQALARIPGLGRLVHIAYAVWRAPETRRQAAADHRWLSEMTEQANSESHANLLLSLPATLRRMTRDIDDLKQVRTAVEYLSGRIEFVRRELMFELRYGAGANQTGSRSDIQPKIIAQTRVKELRNGALRLNLGCGHLPRDEYVNIDRRELPNVDIIAEVTALPFEKGEVDEIYSAHVLEHFPQEQLRRELLPYWKSLLKPTGILRAVVPDADFMMREYCNNGYGFKELREVFFGAQDYDGDFHFNMFSPPQLSELLTEAGFRDVQYEARGRRNGMCYEMAVVARNGEQ